MRKPQVLALGGFLVCMWVVLTYLLIEHSPSVTWSGPRRSGRTEASLEQFKKRLSKFEAGLQDQIKENSILLEQLQALRSTEVRSARNGLPQQQQEPPAAPVAPALPDHFNDRSNKYEDVIGVLMFACNRVTVNKALDAIFRYRPSKEQFPVIVSQDCGHAATKKVLLGYGENITLLEQPDLSEPVVPPKEKKFKGYFKIARHYGWALNETFHKFGFKQIIVVEDDLEVAPDFFQYFQATLPILQKDKSLYCVSAWNDNGKSGLIDESKPEQLYRSDFFGGLGWMLTYDLWKELSVKWPRSYWDDWIRDPAQRRDRACIRPEISRTKTFGKIGVSNGLFYEKHLKFIKLNDKPVDFNRLDLSYLERSKYDSTVIENINQLPVVTLEEVQSGAAAKRHEAVRLLYYTKLGFKKFAKVLGIMDDFKAGVPRMAYQGVVSTMYKGLRVHVSPSLNWKGYDPKW